MKTSLGKRLSLLSKTISTNAERDLGPLCPPCQYCEASKSRLHQTSGTLPQQNKKSDCQHAVGKYLLSLLLLLLLMSLILLLSLLTITILTIIIVTTSIDIYYHSC